MKTPRSTYITPAFSGIDSGLPVEIETKTERVGSPIACVRNIGDQPARPEVDGCVRWQIVLSFAISVLFKGNVFVSEIAFNPGKPKMCQRVSTSGGFLCYFLWPQRK